MKRLLILLTLSAGLVCPPTLAQVTPMEVDEAEILRRGDHVQYVDAAAIGDDDRPTYEDVMAVPPDDAHKWFVSIIKTQGCPACAKLSRDFRGNRELLAFANPDDWQASWGHYKEYSIEDESQQWRWAKVQFQAFPTILIQPPRNGAFGPATTVVYQGVYAGDPHRLAAKIRDSIKKYLAKLRAPVAQHAEALPSARGHRAVEEAGSAERGVRSSECGTEFVAPHSALPVPSFLRSALPAAPHSALRAPRSHHAQLDLGIAPPWKPEPKTPPAIVPLAPVITPGPAIFPWDDTPAADTNPAIGKEPEAVIVLDTDEVGETVDLKGLAEHVRRLRGPSFKVRVADWLKVHETYSLRRDETPAVIVTADGRIEQKITRPFLPFLRPQPAVPAVNGLDPATLQKLTDLLPTLVHLLNPNTPAPVAPTPSVPPTVSGPTAPAPTAAPVLTDFPWTSLISLFTSGGNPLVIAAAALGLGVWGLKIFRRRREAAGKPLLLDDTTFNLLLGKLETLNTDQLLSVLGKLLPAFAAKKDSIVAAHSTAVTTLTPAPASPPIVGFSQPPA